MAQAPCRGVVPHVVEGQHRVSGVEEAGLRGLCVRVDGSCCCECRRGLLLRYLKRGRHYLFWLHDFRGLCSRYRGHGLTRRIALAGGAENKQAYTDNNYDTVPASVFVSKTHNFSPNLKISPRLISIEDYDAICKIGRLK